MVNHTIHLTRADIRKLEEALDTGDLEFLLAAVDRVVELRLAKALNTTVAVRNTDHAA